jgi:hypothetical protein
LALEIPKDSCLILNNATVRLHGIIVAIYNLNRNIMSLLKYAVLGAVVALGVHQLTKKRDDGTSVLDDLSDRSPEFMDKAKDYAAQAIDNLSNTLKERLA